MTAPGILSIYAHTDDESFGLGGALAAYALAGAPMDVLCATHGEAGRLSGDRPVVAREQLMQQRPSVSYLDRVEPPPYGEIDRSLFP